MKNENSTALKTNDFNLSAGPLGSGRAGVCFFPQRTSIFFAAARQTEAPAGSGEQPAAADSEKSGARTERYVRAKDPKWYSEQVAALRAEIDRIDGESRRLREFRASARTSQGGLVLGQSNIPLNPENQIQQLEAQRREVQRQIDALEDQARRNNIAPGVIR